MTHIALSPKYSILLALPNLFPKNNHKQNSEHHDDNERTSDDTTDHLPVAAKYVPNGPVERDLDDLADGFV